MIDIDAIKQDLPDSLIDQLELNPTNRMPRSFKAGELTAAIEELFQEHDELDINQILVGLYQATGVVSSRKTVTATMSCLVKRCELFRLSRGHYSRFKPGPMKYPASFRDPFPPPPGDRHKQLDWVSR